MEVQLLQWQKKKRNIICPSITVIFRGRKGGAGGKELSQLLRKSKVYKVNKYIYIYLIFSLNLHPI